MTPRTRMPDSPRRRSASRRPRRAIEAALGVFADDVDLNECVDRTALSHADLVHARRPDGRCPASEGGRNLATAFALFRCRCPMRCHRTGAEVASHLRQRLLNPILTDVAKSGVPSRLNRISAVGLGHRDDRNRLAMTASPRCRLDLFAYVP